MMDFMVDKFARVSMCVDGHKFIELPPEVQPKVWYSGYIGRKVIADKFEKEHGVNGYYADDDEGGTYLNVKVEIDYEGYVKEISSYKERESDCSSHYRPVAGRELRLNRKDIAGFCKWLDDLLVPVDVPGSYRKPKTLRDWMPDGIAFEDFKKQYAKMIACVRKGDIASLKKYKALVPYQASGFPDLYEIVFKNHDAKMARAIVSYGAYIPRDIDIDHLRCDYDVLCVFWPHMVASGCRTQLRFRDPLTVAKVEKLLALAPRSDVRIHWTPELYRQFCAKDPCQARHLICRDKVDLDAEDFIRLDDDASFKARLKIDGYARPEYFACGEKWAKATLAVGAKNVDYAYGTRLAELAGNFNYAGFRKLAALTTGALPGYAFVNFGAYIDNPPKDKLKMVRFLEEIAPRFTSDYDLHKDCFLFAILKYSDAEFCRKFLSDKEYAGDYADKALEAISFLVINRSDDLYKDFVDWCHAAWCDGTSASAKKILDDIIWYVSPDVIDDMPTRKRVADCVRWIRSQILGR